MTACTKICKDHACGSGDILADRHTDVLITILFNHSHGRSDYNVTLIVPKLARLG